jgi:hypothetical protein
MLWRMVYVDRDYEDDYPTCELTYVALNCFHKSQPAEDVTAALDLTPTRLEPIGWQRSPRTKPRDDTHWSLSSEGRIQSRDFRRHLDWLLDQLEPQERTLVALQHDGWSMNVSVYWLSRLGHGGPELWPRQMASLAAMNLQIWFDVYFADVDDRPLAPGELTIDFQRAASHWRRFGAGESKN